jgi:uncharacterized protein
MQAPGSVRAWSFMQPLNKGEVEQRAWSPALRPYDDREILRPYNDGAMAPKALEDAAREGDVGALWKLGRMYADGANGVNRDDRRAFDYFRGIVEKPHIEDLAGTAQAGFAADALDTVGLYYLQGVPSADIRPAPVQARRMFYYAANFFGYMDAQYHLGRMYLDGEGGGKDTKMAARWLHSAAMKGQHEAQAVLGSLLFKGPPVMPRDAARGLMFLKLAFDAALPSETWIRNLYNAAWIQATNDERAVSLAHEERWREMRGR